MKILNILQIIKGAQLAFTDITGVNTSTVKQTGTNLEVTGNTRFLNAISAAVFTGIGTRQIVTDAAGNLTAVAYSSGTLPVDYAPINGTPIAGDTHSKAIANLHFLLNGLTSEVDSAQIVINTLVSADVQHEIDLTDQNSRITALENLAFPDSSQYLKQGGNTFTSTVRIGSANDQLVQLIKNGDTIAQIDAANSFVIGTGLVANGVYKLRVNGATQLIGAVNIPTYAGGVPLMLVVNADGSMSSQPILVVSAANGLTGSNPVKLGGTLIENTSIGTGAFKFTLTGGTTDSVFEVLNSSSGSSIYGANTGTGYGVYGSSVGAAALRGDSTNGYGAHVSSTGAFGIYASSTNSQAVYAQIRPANNSTVLTAVTILRSTSTAGASVAGIGAALDFVVAIDNTIGHIGTRIVSRLTNTGALTYSADTDFFVRNNGSATLDLAMTLKADRTVIMPKYGGSGTQMVVVDNTGALGIQAILSAPSTQILFGNATSDGVTSSANLKFDSVNKIMTMPQGNSGIVLGTGLRIGQFAQGGTMNGLGNLNTDGILNLYSNGTNGTIRIFPVGTTTEVARFNGTGLLIGTTTNTGEKLQVNGTAKATKFFAQAAGSSSSVYPFQVLSSTGFALLQVNEIGEIKFGGSNDTLLSSNTIRFNGATTYKTIATSNVTGDMHFFSTYGTHTGTSGDLSITRMGTEAGGFAPTSGTMSLTSVNINPILNQTGTASGIVRGIYYNPTVTSVLGEHYAFESTSGKVKVSDLAGATNRVVLADASGVMNTNAKLQYITADQKLYMETTNGWYGLHVKSVDTVSQSWGAAFFESDYDTLWLNSTSTNLTEANVGIIFQINGTTVGAISADKSRNCVRTRADGTKTLDWESNGGVMRMRMFQDGNFAIGSSVNGGFKLDVNGTARVAGNITAGALTGADTGMVTVSSTGVLGRAPLPVSGAVSTAPLSATGTVSADVTLLDSTAGAFTVTVSSSSTKLVYLRKISADTNVITIVPSSGTINGAASVTIEFDGESMIIFASGGNLYTI